MYEPAENRLPWAGRINGSICYRSCRVDKYQRSGDAAPAADVTVSSLSWRRGSPMDNARSTMEPSW
jgi:hypothetical protein